MVCAWPLFLPVPWSPWTLGPCISLLRFLGIASMLLHSCVTFSPALLRKAI